MGSTGSGRFTDYSSAKPTAGGGGSSGNDRCLQAFTCTLEEVALCDFFTQNGKVPQVGTQVSLVLRRRLFAVEGSGLNIGALPTSFNYLVACLEDGINYAGIVQASSSMPVPTVSVDFVAV